LFAEYFQPWIFEKYISVIPKEERNDLISSFYKYLTSSDVKLRSRAAAAWTKWELSTSHLINKNLILISPKLILFQMPLQGSNVIILLIIFS